MKFFVSLQWSCLQNFCIVMKKRVWPDWKPLCHLEFHFECFIFIVHQPEHWQRILEKKNLFSCLREIEERRIFVPFRFAFQKFSINLNSVELISIHLFVICVDILDNIEWKPIQSHASNFAHRIERFQYETCQSDI